MIWRKVDSRGRLPLGKDAMRALGLKAGEEVEVVPNGDGTVTLRKAKGSDDGQ